MSGEPLPYLLRSDWMITSILFLCLILIAYVFSKGRKLLAQQLKAFIYQRDRSSLFDEATSDEISYTFFLILHSCMVVGMLVYYYYSCVNPDLFQMYSHSLLLMGYMGSVVLLFLLKCLVFVFVNWIFFTPPQNSNWISSYYNVTIWKGLLLLPILLLVVYFDLSLTLAVIFAIFILVFIEMLLFFRCFSNFFKNFYGAFHLILYLCTLEILPDILLWKIISITNDFLLQY